MKKLLSAIVVALALGVSGLVVAPADALMIKWQPVTTGFDGNVLQNPVVQYGVWRCDGTVACSKANAVQVGTVQSSVQFFDLSSFPVPARYYVTAINIVGSSSESAIQNARARTGLDPLHCFTFRSRSAC